MATFIHLRCQIDQWWSRLLMFRLCLAIHLIDCQITKNAKLEIFVYNSIWSVGAKQSEKTEVWNLRKWSLTNGLGTSRRQCRWAVEKALHVELRHLIDQMLKSVFKTKQSQDDWDVIRMPHRRLPPIILDRQPAEGRDTYGSMGTSRKPERVEDLATDRRRRIAFTRTNHYTMARTPGHVIITTFIRRRHEWIWYICQHNEICDDMQIRLSRLMFVTTVTWRGVRIIPQ